MTGGHVLNCCKPQQQKKQKKQQGPIENVEMNPLLTKILLIIWNYMESLYFL